MGRVVERIRRALGKARPAHPPAAPADDLLSRARASGDPFKQAEYFTLAEGEMDGLWQRLIWPLIRECDFRRVVDLAAGHGRNSAKLREVAGEIVVVDINDECLAACRARFAGDGRFSFVKTDGASLAGIADASVSLVYCFDSMVHFEREVVRAYLKETRRILEPGGRGFFHHSNYTGNDGGDFRHSPHWRNYMSLGLFARYASEARLLLTESRPIDWGAGPDFHAGLDGVSLVRRPV
jgi:SAM-dependent methyltransferase